MGGDSKLRFFGESDSDCGEKQAYNKQYVPFCDFFFRQYDHDLSLNIYMKKVPARTARRDNFCFELVSLAPVNHAFSRFSAANALVAELFLFKRNAS